MLGILALRSESNSRSPETCYYFLIVEKNKRRENVFGNIASVCSRWKRKKKQRGKIRYFEFTEHVRLHITRVQGWKVGGGGGGAHPVSAVNLATLLFYRQRLRPLDQSHLCFHRATACYLSQKGPSLASAFCFLCFYLASSLSLLLYFGLSFALFRATHSHGHRQPQYRYPRQEALMFIIVVDGALLGTKVNSMASRVKRLVCLWHHEHGRTYRSYDFSGEGRSRVLVS